MKKNVYQVVTKAQLRALATTVRHDILDRLIALGPLSVRQLAEALGRRPTAIYQHLKKLEKLGLVRGKRSSGREPGRPAMVYEPAGSMIRLTDAAKQNENRKALAKIVRVASMQAARDFEAAFSNPLRKVTGTSRNHTFFRALSTPSPARLARINALLQELEDLTWSPDPSPGPLISVAWFVAPLRPPQKA
jgi:DNA-binding transcriptional ArsR family regulator